MFDEILVQLSERKPRMVARCMWFSLRIQLVTATYCDIYDFCRTIVIDAGKTFQAAAVEWFPKFGLRRIDALLITHAHADGRC